jgi:pimeloyl-ACP methyl ester carboxylesterase
VSKQLLGVITQTMCCIVSLICGSALAQSTSPSAPPATIRVPIMYEDHKAGMAALTLDFGAPFDRHKPTVLVIADGQQFYVRPGAMADLQKSTFGDGVNVVGIVTRGTTPAFIQASLDYAGKPDWLKAWKIFNSNEWIHDIEAVRKSLVGENGKIELYGRSGGGYLVHQYLAQYGKYVDRAFTQSAVNPYLNAELGISLDLFWSQLGQQGGDLQKQLQAALAAHPEERINILMTLQRQHFFVSADKIDAARADLIRALSHGDMRTYLAARKEYQVDDMAAMYASNDIIPQDVRVLELISPSGAFDRLGDGGLYPLAETQAYEIKPLLKLLHEGAIQLSSFDFAALHHCTAEVFILAGRYDEAVDYRTEIALASQYPKHLLFIADDNHVFSALTSSGISLKLISSFVRAGIASTAVREAQSYRWIEK